MNFFSQIRNILGKNINPAKEVTLTSIKSQTDRMTFNGDFGTSNLNVDVKFSPILTVLNSVKDLATKTTLDAVQVQTDKLPFDTNSFLRTTGNAPALNVAGVNVKDTTQKNISPASYESMVLWRRVTKILESKTVVSSYLLSADLINYIANNNQRVIADGFGSSTYGIGPTDATVPTLTVANDLVVNYAFASATFNTWNTQKYTDAARAAYSKIIRSKLVFS